MPCGSEEVKCSVENGIMLHGWEKVKRGRAFTNGARPVKGHDEQETNKYQGENHKKAEAAQGEVVTVT